MTLQDAIYQRLTANAALNAAVGGDIYPVEIGQKAVYPAIAFRQVSSRESDTKDNISCMTTYRFQFDIYDYTAESVNTIERLLKQAIDRWRGVVTNVKIDGTIKLDAQDLTDALENVRLFRKSVDYQIRATISQ